MPSGLPFEEIDRVDARLAALGRGVGAMRLRLGEGLMGLDSVGGVKALGFPNLESYCREALGRTGRWGADVRALARRLAELPNLRAALVSGRLTTSMVELVARVATPIDEAEWVERAMRMTVRAMRAEMKSRRAVELEDDETPERVTLATTVDRIDAWAFERARLMVEAVGGVRGERAIEAILAEGLTEILAQFPDIDLPWNLTPEADDDDRAWRAELRAIRETAEAAAESLTVIEPASYRPEPEIAWPEDLAGIDSGLRAAARELAWRDIELAELGRKAADHEIWHTFRYLSFDQYCRERVGLAPSAMSARIALAKRVVALPQIEEAVVAGRIGYEAAAAIARVAGPRTVTAWVARAEARTVKVLREEVAAVEMVARANNRSLESIAPPDRDLIDDVHDIERAVINTISEVRMSGGTESVKLPTDDIDLPRTTLRMSVGPDIARFWRNLESLYARLGAKESFVAFLVHAVTKAWSGALPADVAYAHIYHRDRWRCASPVCTCKSVTPHHVIFRSAGGSDDAANVIALCETCHLELVHGSRLRVTGAAPDRLTWSALGWAA